MEDKDRKMRGLESSDYTKGINAQKEALSQRIQQQLDNSRLQYNQIHRDGSSVIVNNNQGYNYIPSNNIPMGQPILISQEQPVQVVVAPVRSGSVLNESNASGLN